MPRADLVIRNGTLVSGTGRRRADIGIRDGRFVTIDAPGRLTRDAVEEIDAEGLFVLPGLIDAHVHFREPGMEAKEDWLTGSRAAVMGGITTVLEMPNTAPPTATVDSAEHKAALANEKSYCDFGLFGLVGPDDLKELVPLARSGLVVGFKVFLGQTTGGIAAPTPKDLRMAMASLAELGFRLGAHAEDRAIVDRATGPLRAAGRADPLAHLESRPAAAEEAAIRAFGEMARRTRCPVHVFHLSSVEGLRAVVAERAAGADMTCEVSAHHCFLSADYYPRLAGLVKTNPPVREAEHGRALLAALADGKVDLVASDHAPHAPDDKHTPDIWDVAPGIAGVETTVPLFLTRAVEPGILTLEQLVRAMAEAPARAWGLWPRKGSVRIAADADLTIVDLGRRGVVRADDLHGKHKTTPFEGWPTLGAPVATILRGRVVMREGRLVGEPGWGRLVERLPKA